MNAEKMILLSQKLVMLSLAKDNEEKRKLTEEIASLSGEISATSEKTVYCGDLRFSDKEISKMPRTFRKEFRIEGCTAHVRKRCDSRYRCSYEIRYRRNGYNVTASATTLEEAKEKFIKKLHEADKATTRQKANGHKVPTGMNEFANFWFENFHKRKVVEKTYKNDKRIYTKKIAEHFSGMDIRQINARDVQELLDNILAGGFGRTADDVYSILNQILKYAVKFGLIAHNPVDIIIHQRHERQHGNALTLEEEKRLLEKSAGTKYQRMFAVALYTGLRPNEYKTVVIKGKMLVAVNSKRKNGKVEYKRIPINPMLQPYLLDTEKIEWVKCDKIRIRFNGILPNHKLYDLRTTFYTHCVTCGVEQSAIDEMVGHSCGKLKDTYTDLPDDFLYEEAAKLIW